MSKLQQWIDAALEVADSEDMSDDTVIPTWPKECVDTGRYPALTVGCLREWRDQPKPPHAGLEVMGNIEVDEGGQLQRYDRALVLTFNSTDEIRRAIAAEQCTFGFKE
ncbi:hypothetical protein [Marinobacter algicola]|uniref:Uncharacterized protein n=1 Tax=Marinobacter algicola DG893 TaxID=443152 RepID=A6F4T2_9GAMM|nr:hypothetical protein [Marinobacter algicola]EDM46246.1 hypothetical protein MDG893_05069 [Marinobacter algicola DG893]